MRELRGDSKTEKERRRVVKGKKRETVAGNRWKGKRREKEKKERRKSGERGRGREREEGKWNRKSKS